MEALEGLQVVDFGQYLAGPLVAMVLADLGAEVIRVDPPGGPSWDHASNAVLQRGKKSIVLDLKQDQDVDIAQRLIARADVVVENFRPGVMRRLGLGPEASVAANTRLIYCSLPGFGDDDPRAGMQAWEGVIAAAAGLHLYPGCTPANYIGDRTRAPVVSAIPACSIYGAIVALHSIMAALIARERGGSGQCVQVPLFEASFELNGSNVTKYENPPPNPPPAIGGAGGGRPPQLGFYRCADGRWLELCLFQDKHLVWFAERFMPQEWIDDGMADAQRMHTDVALQERAVNRLAELFATRSARDWEKAINDESGASAAISQPIWDWLRDDDHARDNRQVIELEDPLLGPTRQAGFPIRIYATEPSATPRHLLDGDRLEILSSLAAPAQTTPATQMSGADTALPLTGVRVLDVSQVLAGPTVGRILAEYGAEVVKIHSFEDRQLAMHLYTNSGKDSVMVNLKTAEGQEIFWKLAEGIDVFVENFARGVTERLGIGEASLRERNRDVIYASISAFGRDGYRGAWRGREQLGQSVTGMETRLGGYDEVPVMAPLPYCDYGTGNFCAFAALVALYGRLRGGGGQSVHASLAHTGTYLQLPFMLDFEGQVWNEPAGQEARGWSREDRLYECSDEWLYVAGDVDLVDSLAGLSEVELEGRFATEPVDVWVRRLVDAGVAAHRRLDFEEVMEDEYAKARGLSVWRDHPITGRVRLAGPSQRLSRTPPRLTRPVGPPGSDTRRVLEQLGYGEKIDELIAAGVVQDGLPTGTSFIGMFR